MKLVNTAICGDILDQPQPCSCHESSSNTAIESLFTFFNNWRFDTPRTVPPRIISSPVTSCKTWWIICEVVDLPRVPVTPMIGMFVSSANNAALCTFLAPVATPLATYGESSGTLGATKIISLFSKSSSRCLPNTNFTLEKFLSLSTDSLSSASVFRSVTITSAAPACAM